MACSKNRRCPAPRSCLRKRLFEIRSYFSMALEKADFICRQRKPTHHHPAAKPYDKNTVLLSVDSRIFNT